MLVHQVGEFQQYLLPVGRLHLAPRTLKCLSRGGDGQVEPQRLPRKVGAVRGGGEGGGGQDGEELAGGGVLDAVVELVKEMRGGEGG